MNREERVLNVIRRKPVDYLPSQVTLADRSRDEIVAKNLGLSGASELDAFLDNHIYVSLTLADTPLFYRNDVKKMEELEGMGYVKIDDKNKIAYDSWGVGIQIGEDGFFACYHPLEGNKQLNDIAEPFLPDDFDRSILDLPFPEAVRKYHAPDPLQKANFSDLERDLKNYSGSLLVIPSGYLGIYERTYSVMGFEQFMMESLSDMESVEFLMDMVTDYKETVYRKMVEMGFKVGHYGDDLGCQTGPLVSPKQFKTLLLPRMKRLFKVYKDAGLPMIMHSCGDIARYIPDLLEIGLDLLEPVQPCMDFEFLKKEYGERLSFWGGIDTQYILPYGTPAEVKAEAKRVIGILGKNGGYVIAPSQEVMKDVPLENVVALLEAIHESRTSQY